VAGAESQTVIVLGIDPGLANTGYGVVARRDGRLLALDGGVIETSAEFAPERRLVEIHAAVDALLDEHQPDAVALEELYFGQNVRTAFAVGQARGVVLLAAGQHGVACTSYTPQKVKNAVCGNGRAQKDQVGRMVQVLLGLSAQPRPDHAADALAVALCHANCAPLAMALARLPARARRGVVPGEARPEGRAREGAGVGGGAYAGDGVGVGG
jgi:crossover junction endodeoxyribonuclease RuvC